MQPIKKCRFCKEIMTYGPTTTVRITKKMSENNVITTTRELITEYGWRCNMKEDDCDIVFDKKN